MQHCGWKCEVNTVKSTSLRKGLSGTSYIIIKQMKYSKCYLYMYVYVLGGVYCQFLVHHHLKALQLPLTTFRAANFCTRSATAL